MNNRTLGWVIGGAIFIMVVAVWVWQLPNIIKHTAHGTDKGLNGIMSIFGGARTSMSADLKTAQTQLDSNLKKVGQTITAEEAQAAVIQKLKDKIGSKSSVQAATAPNENTNAPGLPTATPKPSTKK
jgi:competence protein ComGC